ncbi:MAG: signal recognition particle-docking protein FtsY [Clostridiaceae bacterium]|jgi:fused signal recognition particle receptor|nr:signal recognition particle-docking protein FtsY [Clostridiaceae bacterium]
MNLLERFRTGMKKTRDFVSAGFTRIAASMGRFDDEMLDDLEALLVQADCGATCAAELLEKVRDNIRDTGDASAEAVAGTLHAEMMSILGEARSLQIKRGTLNILLMVGVNGTGKTTTAGKLCQRFQNEGLKCVLSAADTFRAAAIEQLQVWGQRTGTPVISHAEGSDPAAVVFDSIHAALARKADVLIVDTAGRLHNKQNLMDELSKIRRIIAREAPDAVCTTLLVIDATTGQNAVLQARAFTEAAHVDGIAITKLDGNAKGGVALAVAHETRVPILLSGLGEQVDDLVDFDPDAFVRTLLPEEGEGL